MNMKGHELVKFYQEFLISLKFEGYDREGVEVTISPPIPRDMGSDISTNQFTQPWAFFINLEGDSKFCLHEFLIW